MGKKGGENNYININIIIIYKGVKYDDGYGLLDAPDIEKRMPNAMKEHRT